MPSLIIFATSRPLIEKFLLQNVSQLIQGVQINFQNRNGIIQTGNGILSPFPGLGWKIFFYKMILIHSKGFKIDIQNRKCNYPNRRWNHFPNFEASDQKISFAKCFSFILNWFKIYFSKQKWNYPNRKRTYFSISRPLIKNLLLQNVSHLFQGVQDWFSKQEMSSKQEMESFIPLPGFWWKKFFYKILLNWSKWSNINFQNRIYGIIQTGNGIFSMPLVKELLLQNVTQLI